MELIFIVIAIVWIYCSFGFIKDKFIEAKRKKNYGEFIIAALLGIAYIIGGCFVIVAVVSSLQSWLPSSWQ